MPHYVILLGLLTGLTAAEPLVVTSPNGILRAEVLVMEGTVRYRLLAGTDEVLQPSGVGLTTDGVPLAVGAVLGTATWSEIDERYPVFGGKSQAHHRARQATIPVTTGHETWTLDVRVANDGVAVRCRLPARAQRAINADGATWNLPGNVPVWASYRSNPCYENMLFRGTLHHLTIGKTLDLPLTARVGSRWIAITEAALRDYGDLAVARTDDDQLTGRLVADPQGWKTDDAVTQPWRVTLVAQDLSDLVNSTLVQDLNPPPRADLAQATWIRPGRAAWQWMAVGDPKFAEQSQWIAWTKALGFEYYLVDDGWKRWQDGTRDAWACLAAVVAEARAQGVAVWLWVHSKEVQDPAARAAYLDRCAAAGVVGVKIDFMPATNRWWSTWYEDTARDAADRRLMVNFHGATKPTGMERTWPNELTREGIRGHEWQMTRYQRVLDPAHDTILPFTRYLAGHGDYTPTVFDPKELAGNSWAHELAQAVVFTSPFLCYGGHPRDYVANPAMDVLKAIPATWDETRLLAGTEPGLRVLSARRRGDAWFVGVLNGAQAATLPVALDFLGAGTWSATILGDVPTDPAAWDRREETVTSATTVSLALRPQGGAVLWLRPAR